MHVQEGARGDVVGKGGPIRSSYMASYRLMGPGGEGQPHPGTMGWHAMDSLRPGARLVSQVVDVYVDIAARYRRDNMGEDVRVVPCDMMTEWQMWTERGTPQQVPDSDRWTSVEPPDSLKAADFRGAHTVMWVWHADNHYSTVVITNAGKVTL